VFRRRAVSPARGDALQRRSGSSHRRQHPELARLHLFTCAPGPGIGDAPWRSTSCGYVPPAINKGAPNPRAGARLRSPSHDRLHQRRRGRRAPPRPRTARLPQPCPGHHRRQHLAADRVRDVTRPWTCSLRRRRSASKECLVNGLRIRAAWHSECHSRQVRYSVLDSKNCHHLEPPYGIEP
jgi:hypothetical protein